MDNLHTLVFISKLPFETDLEIYPTQRKLYIESATNSQLKKQRFYSWKLLQRCLKDFGIDINDLEFFCQNGKWSAKDIYFSITHCNDVCAVAVSKDAVGIDLEAFNDKRFVKLKDKILTKAEREELDNQTDKGRFIASCWVKKEATFKRDGGSFSPTKIETLESKFILKEIYLADGAYAFALSAPQGSYKIVCLDNLKII